MRRHAIALSLLAASTFASAQNYTAPWYNPAETGWGLNITHQGDVLFPTWFTYDVDGKPLWLIVSGARKQADGSYTGEVFRTTGVPFNQINNAPSLLNVNKLGTARLVFPTPDSLNFSYTLNGVTQSKTLQKLAIGSGTPVCETTTQSRAGATNFTDMWWNPSESGWGVNIFQQEDNIFATWFTYGEGNRDAWYMVSGTTKQADGSLKGKLYRINSGTPLLQINGQAAVAQGAAIEVGEMTFRFSTGERGTMTYTLNGVTQTKNIERQQFGDAQTVCKSQVATGGGGGGGGGASGTSNGECYGVIPSGVSGKVRFNQSGAPQSMSFITTYKGLGAAAFRGQNAFAEELTTDISTNTSTKQYARINADGSYETIGSESFTNGVKTSESYFTNGRNLLPKLAVGASTTYSVRQVSMTPGQPDLIADLSYEYQRLPNESVTVAGGTFNACKFQTKVTTMATAAGFVTNVVTTGPVWTLATHPQIKSDIDSTATVFGANVTTKQSTELLSQ